jgi:ABC-type branched-subunit amino acid transport system substrate-binding protein
MAEAKNADKGKAAGEARRGEWLSNPLPIRLGWLNDSPPSVGGLPIVQFVVERFNKLKRIDREVELCMISAQGSPAGRIANIYKAWLELKEMGCLIIMGPSMSDSCIEMCALIQEHKVPTITTGATSHAIGEWYFDIPWGACPEEGYFLVNWLLREGHKRVGVTYDMAYHAGEYLRHFRAAARRAKIEIGGEVRVQQLDVGAGNEGAKAALASLRKSNVEAIVHLGSGFSAAHIASAWKASDWNPPLAINDSYYVANIPEMRADFEGVVGLCYFDEENPVYREARRDYIEWAGAEPQHPELFAIWYTMTSAALEGIALAPILSVDGTRRGLESITMLPSAMGGPRSAVSFSPWNHRGLGGADVLVMRRAKNGKSVLEMRYDPMLAKLV